MKEKVRGFVFGLAKKIWKGTKFEFSSKKTKDGIEFDYDFEINTRLLSKANKSGDNENSNPFKRSNYNRIVEYFQNNPEHGKIIDHAPDTVKFDVYNEFVLVQTTDMNWKIRSLTNTDFITDIPNCEEILLNVCKNLPLIIKR